MNKILIVLFILFLILFTTVSYAADVNISPLSASVNVGSQVTLTLNVDNVTNFFGVAFDLIFNPSILSFVSAQKGNFLEQSGAETTLLTTVSPPGDLIVGYSRLASGGIATGVSGSGALMTLIFNASSTGVSNLTFQNNALCDANSSSTCGIITTTWNNGLITVNTSSDITPPTAPTGLTVQ